MQVVVAFFHVGFGGDVARGAVAVTRYADEAFRPHFLRGELVFHVGFAGQEQELRGAEIEGKRLGLANLSAAIAQLATLPPEQTATLLGHADKHLGYLLSDMLLVEGLMTATGGSELQVAEIDLTNLPGLIADSRAYAWSGNYACYLARLRTLGLAAYASDPASCAAPEKPVSR